MKIIELKYKDESGNISDSDELELLEDQGIKKDINSKRGDKEISILFVESKEEKDKKDYRGLCTKRFYENITVQIEDVSLLKVGSRIRIGKTLIEITIMGKKCFDECVLIKENKKCILSSNASFAKVIKEGSIKTQNQIEIID